MTANPVKRRVKFFMSRPLCSRTARAIFYGVDECDSRARPTVKSTTSRSSVWALGLERRPPARLWRRERRRAAYPEEQAPREKVG